MEIFEYLPQLIVAYDGNDEFANLIHVKKADRYKDYYCPCCGGTVKPRALDSDKEQSHYYHKTGKCTKESQLHFFCKNWLFEEGSKFYIEDKLFEVVSIDIEKNYPTQFGDYKPDISVHTSDGKTIYFEMFFTNRKTGDDYFCKWDSLGNDVVEVNIKEYMFKTDITTIPSFTYLYHDGDCYSMPYIKRDLYANTIARIKHELTRQKVLNYKARIEQLDWFWQEIRNNTRESILKIVSKMEYEDMISCYEIIKRKQCVSYLKDDILNIINQKVISDVRESLDLPTSDKDIYFDLEHIRGRTYEAGIRLNFKSEHIVHNILYAPNSCCYNFEILRGFPKIVFSKNIMNKNELIIPENKIEDLKKMYDCVVKHKKDLLEYEKQLSEFEDDVYKVKVNNDLHTVLKKADNGQYEVIFENRRVEDIDIKKLSEDVENEIKGKNDILFLNTIQKNEEFQILLSDLKDYKKDIDYNVNIKYDKYYTKKDNRGIYFELYFHNKRVYKAMLQHTLDDFINKINDCKKLIDAFVEANDFIVDLIEKINDCKNNFWKAELLFDYNGFPEIKIDQKLFKVKNPFLSTYEKVCLDNLKEFSEEKIIQLVENAMNSILKNVERCGYRVMEEHINEKKSVHSFN